MVLLAIAFAAQAGAQVITVDAAADRRPINPLIYGVGLATEEQVRDLNAPINRYGGNLHSRYNWMQNAYNHAFDFYFESISAETDVPGDDVDRFIAATRRASAEPMVTVPMIGWVAKLGPDRAKLASFSIAKYGPQTDSDKLFFPDAGNGVRLSGEPVTGNDPNDANVLSDVAFQRSWVQRNVGVRYYALDNEPSLWHETHRDVHPDGQTLEEIRDRIIDYARMVKSIDPQAIVAGPEEWGYLGYRYSGSDLQYAARNNYNGVFPDRMAHGDLDQVPWILREIRNAEQSSGTKLLDLCSVHIYPQSGEFSGDVSPAMQSLRNRSTRSLWDRDYRDVSYIDDEVYLIPRMHEWVAENSPGILIGITEYNWGAENHINGATTQADILGIFGREGLDVATRYATPDSTTPTYKAMKMYRDYDGRRSGFGDLSVRAIAPDPDSLSAFAALRGSDGALTIMLINKQPSAAAPMVTIAGFVARGVAEVWHLTAENQIQRLGDLRLAGNRLEPALPGQSITLLVVPRAAARRRAVR